MHHLILKVKEYLKLTVIFNGVKLVSIANLKGSSRDGYAGHDVVQKDLQGFRANPIYPISLYIRFN